MNKERTILYLFSINAIIYIASGFYTPFLSAYYAQKGIDAEKIGILLMIGPCVVLGCVYGHYLPVLREVSRYLGIHFDNAHEQGIYSL